jgi:ligand-binding sensor domain-containing protein
MRYLLCLLVTCFFTVAAAQELPVQKYTNRNGLGNSIVYRITQTQDGVLWFSTDDGLTRYDGSVFTNYSTKDGLQSSFIFGTLETDSSLLVCSYGAGVINFLGDTCYRLNSYNDQLKYPIDLFRNKAGLWSIDRNGIVYHFEGSSFERVPTPEMGNCITTKVLEISSGDILITTCSYLSRYVGGNELEKLVIPGLPVKAFHSLLELKDHTILVTTDSALYAISPQMTNARQLMKGNFKQHWESLLQDHEGNVWVCTLSGELWLFSEDLKRKKRVFQNIIINDLFEDSDNNIWLATYGQGVWCIPNLHVHAYTIDRMAVTDLVLDKRYHRVIISDLSQGTVVLDKGLVTDATGSNLPAVLHKRASAAMLCTDDEYIICDSKTQLFRQRKNRIDSLKLRNVVAAVYKDAEGYYWTGVRNGTGLIRIHPDFKQRTPFEQFKGVTVRSIAGDAKGRILAGTNNGLFLQSGTAWKRFGRVNGLPNDYVNVVFFDQKNNCHWIGTNAGVCLLQQGEKITGFNDPLSKLRCNAIVCDRQNNVWMATPAGLVRYAQGIFSLFGEKDGMPSDIFKLCYDEDEDKLYMLVSNQIYEIAVAQFIQQQSKRIPAVTVNAIMADGNSMPRSKGMNRFLHAPEYVAMKISLPVFKNAAAWSVYSRIDGREWRLEEKKNELLFTKLPFGHFNIELKVVNKDLRTSTVVIVPFDNPKPFYWRFWFLLLAGCTLMLPGILVTRYITRRINRRKEQTLLAGQQRLELEQKALLNMLNPHFMNNALNSIQAFVTRNDQRTTLNYLSQFAKLMRVNLELLETNTITLEKELQNVALYLTFEKLRFSNNLTYTIELHPDIKANELMMPSLVLQPFVENAIWHGILPARKPGCVSIRVLRKEHSLYIFIEDDGIGLTASRKRKETEKADKPSRGLKIIQGRFALLNKSSKAYAFTIQDKQEMGYSQTGTSVEIILPYIHID